MIGCHWAARTADEYEYHCAEYEYEYEYEKEYQMRCDRIRLLCAPQISALDCVRYSSARFRPSTEACPGGGSNWQLPRSAQCVQLHLLGRRPNKKRIGSARSVAASRGSTGTRPMEAQHCDNLRCTSVRLRPSTEACPGGGNNWQLPRYAQRVQLHLLGLRPNQKEDRVGEKRSCQSWLHRHKADGGPTLR